MMGKVTGKPLYLDKKYPVEFSLQPIHWDPIMTGAEVSGQHYQLQQPPAGLGQGSGGVSKGLNLIWDVCAAVTRQTTWVYRMIYAPFYAEPILRCIGAQTHPPTHYPSHIYKRAHRAIRNIHGFMAQRCAKGKGCKTRMISIDRG